MAIKTGKRELIDTGTDKRYVKRHKDGTFKESVDVGRSLASDRRSKSKTVAFGSNGPKATVVRSQRASVRIFNGLSHHAM